jgi:GT2 family glycosyltransferase/glycosyltransferase involved in cell wall biosynthesis
VNNVAHDAGTSHFRRALATLVNAAWYRERYPDIAAAGLDPVDHFVHHGILENRAPNRFFDAGWYRERYADVAASGINPLLHYLTCGASELRNPHPRFDAAYYASEHPDAASNPLLFHVRIGAARGFATEKPLDIGAFLPSTHPPLVCPSDVCVDVVIPVYRGLEETQRCLHAVLADRAAPLGRILVVEDRSPEADLIAWLQHLAKTGVITLLRNKRNLGFVASVNRGMAEAARNDVVLLNSDTEVPKGWLRRLAAQAYAQPRVASVSPFSNNATICGYPDDRGGAMAFGHDVATLDDLCQTVNAARSIAVPTTVGFCMYIRRAALDAVGAFNAERFREGYGEENDFCLRATAKGWTHRLACDSFVYHQGQVSFGDRRDQLAQRAQALLCEDFPDYPERVARHVQRGDVTPFRFALSAGLFRKAAVPVILMVSHDLGGGVRRHIDMLVSRFHTRARMLLLEGTDRGARLSIPALPHHPTLTLPADRTNDLLTLLQSFNVSRVHIHHLIGMDLDIQQLIRDLNVPFDTTVHDYYPICPQRNLLPWEESLYCGEPGPAVCNACIADANDVDRGARDILSWRLQHAWQLTDADRVLCPSKDVKARLSRYQLARHAVVIPHEEQTAPSWDITPRRPSGASLRVALIGTLANVKGNRMVAAVAGAARRKRLSIHLIGATDENFPPAALGQISQTGAYQESDLPALLRESKPHVVWFASTAPETYSFTLTVAINTGLPIVATDLGAFRERLDGRPLTWLVDYRASPEAMLGIFEQVRHALQHEPPKKTARRARADGKFYAKQYLQPARKAASSDGARTAILAVPERDADGRISRAGYERLLHPLSHPAIAGEQTLRLARADFSDQDFGVVVLQPRALRDAEAAENLLGRIRDAGAKLIVDLSEPAADAPSASVLRAADAIWAATPGIVAQQPGAILVETRLDERIWQPMAVPARKWADPIRLLCLVDDGREEDFALVEPVLARLMADYPNRIAIDVVGALDRSNALNIIRPPAVAVRSHPAFVHWLRNTTTPWHIGVAPSTVAGSAARLMEYAALGLATVASDVPGHRRATDFACELVPNSPDAWHEALAWLIRNQNTRNAEIDRARTCFEQCGSLSSAAAVWRSALALDDRG